MTGHPRTLDGPSRRPTRASTNLYRWLVFSFWLLTILAVCLRVSVSPHRQSVYSADYESAGWHWYHGQEVYSLQRHFVYGPPAAATLVPFAVLPNRLGNVLWRLVCTMGMLYIATKWLRSGLSGLGSIPPPPDGSIPYITAFLLLLPLAAGNINLGQMNLPVLVLTAGSVLAARQHRWNLAALLIASAGFIKIYPLAVGMLLAVLYPRDFTWRLILAVVAVFVVSLGMQHPSYVWSEYHHWFATLNGDDRLDTDLYASWRDLGFLLRACGLPLSDRVYRVMEVGAGAVLAIFLWWGQRRGKWTQTRLLGGVFSLGCAWMMLFGPATEAATYVVLSLTVCTTLVAAWAMPASGSRPGARVLPVVFASSYALLVLADLVNAWMHGITHHLYVRALQPVAALLFAAGIVWWLVRWPVMGEEVGME